MKTTVLSIIWVLAIAGTSAAYDLPEVIGVLEEEGIFATDFCWVGDQNGDGCDDLLIRYSAGNQALLYYGDEQMENEPGFIFEPYLEQQEVCDWMNFIGNIIPDCEPYISFLSPLRANQSEFLLNLYEGGENLDNDPDITISRVYHENSVSIGYGFKTRPADLNGDGFNDLIAIREQEPSGKLLIFWGGEDFDTIPDWEKCLNIQPNLTPTVEYSSGYDVNNDDCDDILIKYRQLNENNSYVYALYLGGSPMDTVPVFSFRQDHFEGRFEQRRMIHGFSLLPDVNDDGYDDWGIYWSDDEDDGFFIFFGSEEPDMEPDLELEGHRRLWRGDGGLTGSDFNGDGIGDIVTRLHAGNPEMSEIHIHFGSRWMDGDTDIFINLEREYNGQYFILPIRIGAAGDYNGDDVDDFVISGSGRAIIFAGNSDWERGVDSDEPPDNYKLTLQTSPNPFNSSTKLSFNLPRRSDINVAVFDVNGRQISRLIDGIMDEGDHHINWLNQTAGIYFVMLQAGDRRVVRKVVCLP